MPEALNPQLRMSAERQAELFEAVVWLVQAVGYDSLTYDAVAARARTSKATLYRHWPTKATLVAAALQHGKSRRTERPIADSLIGDLRLLAESAWDPSSERGERDANTQLAFGLMHAMSTDAEFAEAARASIIAPTLADLSDIFARAATRGEIADNPALFHELSIVILGRFLLLKLFTRDRASVEALTRHVELVVMPAVGYRDGGSG
ncbi:MAG: Transcriptional regulator, TetR family [Frankiales bacterium]|nr:Transcriptional regulator, TetR family [Frankiales bacterium]